MRVWARGSGAAAGRGAGAGGGATGAASTGGLGAAGGACVWLSCRGGGPSEAHPDSMRKAAAQSARQSAVVDRFIVFLPVESVVEGAVRSRRRRRIIGPLADRRRRCSAELPGCRRR